MYLQPPTTIEKSRLIVFGHVCSLPETPVKIALREALRPSNKPSRPKTTYIREERRATLQVITLICATYVVTLCKRLVYESTLYIFISR